MYHVTGSQLIINVLHICSIACRTNKAKKLLTNATCTDIKDLEFNDKIGIQSSLYSGDNAVVQTENLNGENTFHWPCQIFSAIVPDQLAQGSFGKTIQRKKVDCATIPEDRIDIRPFKKAKNKWLNMLLLDSFSW